MSPTLELVGTIRPNRRSLLGSEVPGLVVEMAVDDGDAVKKGQIVCRLRDAARRYELANAEAELARLKDALDELEAGERAEELDRLKAAHEEALAQLRMWEFERTRIQNLRGANSSSEKEYNDTMMMYNTAVSRERQAEAALRRGKAGARVETVRAARHAVEAQAARVDRLRDDRSRMSIAAPFDGFVAARRTEVGQWVMEGGSVAELVEINPVRVRVNVPEGIVSFAAIGAPVEVLVEALRRTLPGRIARVVPDADAQARTFPVDIEMENSAGTLKPGMFVRARVPAGASEARLVVPKDAVVRSPRGMVVWVVRSGKDGDAAMPAPVRTGDESQSFVAIAAEGLSAGDRVVVRGNERLQAPGPVIAVPWSGSEPAASRPATMPAHNEGGERAR